MITAPPLDPAAEDTTTEDVSAEKRCIAKFRKFRTLRTFDVLRSYATLSPEFGVIVRLDLEEAASGLAATFMCWTDEPSGDLVSAVAVGHKLKLPD